MPRGKARCTYVTDLGLSYWVWVDRDSLADANRGWALASLPALSSLARGFLPRRVVGIDTAGSVRYARCGTNTAALWTGAVTSWSYEGTDGLPHQATVIGRQEERPTP